MTRIKSRTRRANKINDYFSACVCMFVVAFLVFMVNIASNPERAIMYVLDLLPPKQSSPLAEKSIGPLSDSLTNSIKNIEMSKFFVELSSKEM